MTRSYSLTASQKTAWINLLPPMKRGTAAKIAVALKRKLGGTEGTWKTQLSRFFKGEEPGLRAIYDQPDSPTRIQILAGKLGLEPDSVRRWLDDAQGIPPVDGPLQVRIPGFEDFGPVDVLVAFHPPPQRETRIHLPKHERMESAGGRIQMERLLEAVTLHREGIAKALVIAGPRRSGKTTLLKAIASELEQRGLTTKPWASGDLDERCFVVHDDLNLLPEADRKRLWSEAEEAGSTVIAVTSDLDALSDLPDEQIVCTLKFGEDVWARQYLDHLEGVLEKIGRKNIDLGPLRDWLDDDPYAAALTTRVETLGFLARHVADGGQVPVRHRQFVDLAIKRWSALLRQREQGPVARVLEVCGRKVLARAATEACLAGTETIDLTRFARLLVEETSGVAGVGVAWEELGALGMLTVVDHLIDVKMLQQHGDDLRPSQRAIFVSALGQELADRLDDDRLVQAVLLNSDWHDSLLAAAEVTGDLAPLLRAIDRQSPAVLSQSFQALTRLLGSHIHASDRTLLEKMFVRALWWWSVFPAEQRTISMTMGAKARPEALPTPFSLIGHVAPLIAMGIASRQNRDQITEPITVEQLLALDIGEELRAYVHLMRTSEPDPDAAKVAIFLGAPYQSDLLRESKLWHQFPGKEVNNTDIPAGISWEEYQLWWRTVAAPRLLETVPGKRRVAGMDEPWTITSGMTQREQGSKLWADALFEFIEQDDPNAPAAFAEAVAMTLSRGGDANHGAIQDIWSRIRRETRRRPIRNAVKSVIESLSVRDIVYKDHLSWVLRDVVRGGAREDLWNRWLDDPDLGTHHSTWKCFIDGRLDPTLIVDWATQTMPDDPRPKTRPVERNEGTGTGAVVAFQLFEAQDTPQAQALDALVESSRLDILTALLKAPMEWREKAWYRIEEHHPADLRRIKLEKAPGLPRQERGLILQGLQPRSGEQVEWEAIAEAADTLSERLLRWVQVCCALDDEEDRWSHAEEDLRILEYVAEGRETGREKMLDLLCRADDQDPDPERDQGQQSNDDGAPEEIVDSMYEDVAPLIDQVLGSVGVVLQGAYQDKLIGIEPLVEAAFSTDQLRPRILGDIHHGWWALAWKLFGDEFVVDALRRGHDDPPDGQASLIRLDTCVNLGLFNRVVLPLVDDPVLGEAATRVVARRVRPERSDLILDALVGQPLQGSQGQPNSATLELVTTLARGSNSAAIAWLSNRLEDEDPMLCASWWEAIIPVLSPGASRAEGLSEWHQVRSPSSELGF